MSPTTVIATLALMFAMAGGAYAASKYVITSTKQISPKVLKALKGKAGPAGPAGPAGAAGAGTAGAQGAAGAKGETGKEGAQGKEGVKGETGKEGVKGVQGIQGVKGEQGEKGVEGSPWTAGGLPKGASERGSWTVSERHNNGDFVWVPLSFPVPLANELIAERVHYIGTNEELAGETNESPAIANGECTGSPAKPEAKSGNLCIFARVNAGYSVTAVNGAETGSIGAGKSGAYIIGSANEAAEAIPGEVLAAGVWVVTG